ncbi:hypothetical protein HT737_30585, partial [Pseudomonas sp. MD195_PC81_125]|uniref:hypothetical protein n=1 Tax=Pseudomonas sp. MD195_PC81_125 TaxID=2741560 RepID=UPI0015FD639F|nr:hypothetical protein [Pseudomonas sp. MD195_PC81_125]MBA5978754.1 hypothetical protein [Pseudomonas sp. MD195_PC81_125]MBA5983751.1 hypothetical protein [Pseudomonas sp. MD195_PC81_125]
MTKFQKEDFMRNATFEAETEIDLLEKLSSIKGYELIDIKGTDRSFGADQRFLLKSDSGQEIMILHEEGAPIARTGNVFGQDEKEEPTPVTEDEVVKLGKAAQLTDGLSTSVSLSNHDMGFSRAELEE